MQINSLYNGRKVIDCNVKAQKPVLGKFSIVNTLFNINKAPCLLCNVQNDMYQTKQPFNKKTVSNLGICIVTLVVKLFRPKRSSHQPFQLFTKLSIVHDSCCILKGIIELEKYFNRSCI